LAVLFVSGVPSLTHALTGQDAFGFYPKLGSWLSLLGFASLAYVMVWLPLRRR